MRRDPILTLLAGGLLLAVILTAALCYWYVQCSKQLSMLQSEVAELDQRRAFIQAVATDASEYARRNPAILPVLEAAGIHTRQGTNTSSAK
jgi:hypothetical protein